MNTQFTEATRPRIRSGDITRRIVFRMIMLIPSVSPAKNRATSDTMNIVDSAEHDHAQAEPGDGRPAASDLPAGRAAAGSRPP